MAGGTCHRLAVAVPTRPTRQVHMRHEHKQEAVDEEARFDRPPVRVALECSYGSRMSARERQSLAHQIVRIYGINRNAERPLSLFLTALSDANSSPGSLPSDGFWKEWPDITRVSERAEEHWPYDELVWLSPDAHDPLLELDLGKVYIVGGIIDRSVISKLTLRRASEKGISCQRLPLKEHAPARNVHPILTPLAVISILSAVHSGSSWEQAIAASLPQRLIRSKAARGGEDKP